MYGKVDVDGCVVNISQSGDDLKLCSVWMTGAAIVPELYFVNSNSLLYFCLNVLSHGSFIKKGGGIRPYDTLATCAVFGWVRCQLLLPG